LTCVKDILVQLFKKILGLDMALFSEKVENHWSRLSCTSLIS